MTPRILILTTVHSADDTRIRERLIRTLSPRFDILYATRDPAPTDPSNIEHISLKGGRIVRNLRAVHTCFTARWSILILHDPETIPLGILARLLTRRNVVFDVHENLPDQILAKGWIPAPLKPAFRLFARVLLRLAERFLTLSLAEPGYQHLFRDNHPVFANYPSAHGWPAPLRDRTGGAIYVGDVTPIRGVTDAVDACARAGVFLSVVGPYGEAYGDLLLERASKQGAELALSGRVDHPTALKLIGEASVGLSPLRRTPNYEDSLPTKVLEYLAMGVPVVATDLRGTRRAIGDLEAVWLCAPDDVDDMANAITSAATTAAKDAAVSQAQHVRERFSWPAEEVREFYATLVES